MSHTGPHTTGAITRMASPVVAITDRHVTQDSSDLTVTRTSDTIIIRFQDAESWESSVIELPLRDAVALVEAVRARLYGDMGRFA